MNKLELLIPLSVLIAVAIVLFLSPSSSLAEATVKGLLVSALATAVWTTGLFLYLWYLESR
jgi:uncharacterized membrane-anchored protein YitT (DUF2179 family)